MRREHEKEEELVHHALIIPIYQILEQRIYSKNSYRHIIERRDRSRGRAIM